MRFARASLKQDSFQIFHLLSLRYPVRFARASLKQRRIADEAAGQLLGYPVRFARASLKRI